MRSLAVALIVVLAGGSAAHAAAKPKSVEAEALARIDGDAPVVALVRLNAESAIWAWLRRFDGGLAPYLKDVLVEIGQLEAPVLGFDATAGWAPSGLDTAAPIVASLFAVDASAAEQAFHQSVKGKTAAHVFVRSRVVATIADDEKLRAMLATIAGSDAGHALGAALVADAGATGTIAAAWNAPAKDGKTIARALAASKIVAVAAVHGAALDTLIVVRIEQQMLVIDVLSLFGGTRLDWKTDHAAVSKLIARKPTGADAILAAGAGSLLVDAGAAVDLDPGRLLDLAKVLGWGQVLAARVSMDASHRDELTAQGEQEVAHCDALRELTKTGAFSSAALVFRAVPGQLSLRAAWTVRAGTLGALLTPVDDGLVEPARADAVALGALYAGTEALAKLPRLAGKTPLEVEKTVMDCGALGGATVAIFGWPYLYGPMVDDLSGDEAKLAPLATGVRNVAFALTQLDPDPAAWIGVVLASVDASVGSGPFDALAARAAKRTTVTIGKRQLSIAEPKHKDEPTLFTQPDAGRTGLAYGGVRALEWFFAAKDPPKGNPMLLGWATVDLPRALREMTKRHAVWQPWLDDLAKRTGALQLLIDPTAGMLSAVIKLEIR